MRVLPPGTAHLLPVMDRGCQDHYPALGLGDLGRICLDAFLQFLQALPGSKVPFGLSQTPEDAKRIYLTWSETELFERLKVECE